MSWLKYIPHPHWRWLNSMWLNSRSTPSLERVGRVCFIRTCKLCGKIIDNGSRRGR